MGATVSPSQKESTLTSGPVKNSSTTMRLPDAPKSLSSMIERTASFASARSRAMTTPLPSASPSALTTVGKAFCVSM